MNGLKNWRFLTGYQIGGGTYLIDDGSGPTIQHLGIPNEDFTWRENRISNIGLDGSFWKGLLGFELDVFYREQANVLKLIQALCAIYVQLYSTIVKLKRSF